MIEHPIYINYWYNPDDGFIYSKTQTQHMRRLKNTKDKLGYIEKTLIHNNKKIITSLHRFIWECYNQKIIPDKHHIDHIDGDNSNNNIDNLQCLSASEHSKKTRRTNQNSNIMGGKTRGISGKAINENTNQEIIFDSISDLAKKLNCSSTLVLRFLTGKIKTPPNDFSMIIFDNNYHKIEGEIWKEYIKNKITVDIVEKFLLGKTYISNMGRLYENRQIKYGQVDKKGYMLFGNKRVHILVMEYFGTNKPSNDCTIDHINNNPRDNRLLNLRWATAKEQNFNQKRHNLYQISMWNGYTGECIGKYNNYTDIKCKQKLSNDNKVLKTSSIRREWFVSERNYMINIKRLEFIKNKLLFKNKASQRQFKPEDYNNSLNINHVTHDANYYIYTLKPTKFTNMKKYSIRIKKTDTNGIEKIRNISLKNQSAQVIQCYWRSYIRFKDKL